MTASPTCNADTPLSGIDFGKGTLPVQSQEAELLRQYVIVHLLQKVCSFFDHTPRTFFEHFLQMVRYGILSHDALSGSLPPLGLPVIRPALAGPTSDPTPPENNTWRPFPSSDDSLSAKEVPVPEELAMFRSESWDTALPALRRRVSRFEKDFMCVERLGAGAFGEVWHCRHRIDGRDYAIKVVPFQCQGSEKEAKRVLREVQCWSRLSHPNIARYNSAWVESDWASAGCWQQLTAPAGSPGATGSPPLHLGEFGGGAATRRRVESYCSGDPLFTAQHSPRSCDSFASSSISSDNSDGGFVWSGRAPGVDVDGEGETQDGSLVPCTDPPPCDLATSLDNVSYDFTLYIQSELCRKDTLQDWLHKRNGDSTHGDYEQRVREALEIFGQSLHALDHVHASGCVHRDLKPSNVFFSLDGIVRLGDFGLAKDLLGEPHSAGERKRGSGVVGTLSYSSPEQLAADDEREVGFKTDIFSLGLMIAELFCPAGTQMERVKLFEQLRASQGGEMQPDEILLCCPFPALRRIVRAMTSADPQSRPSAKHIIAQYIPELLTEVASTLGQDVVLNLGGWDSPPQGSPVMVAQVPPVFHLKEEDFASLPLASVPEALRVAQLGSAIVGAVGNVLDSADQTKAFKVVRDAVAGSDSPPATFETLQQRLEALSNGVRPAVS